MNAVLFVNATIGFSENLSLVFVRVTLDLVDTVPNCMLTDLINI